VELPALRAGLPGKESFDYRVPPDPACKAELAGALPVEIDHSQHLRKKIMSREGPA